MPVYIELIHGRRSKYENLDDWGPDGPVLGPFTWVHTTYACHVRCGIEGTDALDMMVHSDLLFWDGMYYGDWSVFDDAVLNQSKELKARLVKITDPEDRRLLTPKQARDKKAKRPVSWS
jgi:hypothetical protein